MAIEIFFETAAPARIKRAAPLFKKAVRAALGTGRSRHTACLVFTGDPGIKKLNKRFLGRNRFTDVIAFNYPSPPGFKLPPVFGDIYVSLPQAVRQARAMRHSVLTELLILAVHGALHLAGMNDATAEMRRRMNLKTVAILKKLS